MSIGEAKAFIHRGMQDRDLRNRLNASGGPEDMLAILEREKLVFTYSEFDEAYHNLLTQCQEEEQAEQLKDFKMWWDLIRTMPASGNTDR
jgi:hypothetical protein